MTCVLKTYNTWHEFVRDADQTNGLNPSKRSSREHDAHWSGTNSFEETLHLATHGWPEGLRRIKDNVHIIERFISHKQPRKVLEYSVRGPGILDLERYQQGRPDSWITWEEQASQEGKSNTVVPIMFNIGSSGGVNIKTLFLRGAAVCALIDVLEHSNIRVELCITVNNHVRSLDITHKVVMKRSEDALDMDRLAFALCNASTYRRLMFSIWEQQIPHLPDGYGIVGAYKEDGAINISAASLSIRSEADMVPWLVKQLAGYGVEVQD